MKKLVVLLISVVAISATAQDNPKYLNVLAVNGLNMRSQPDSKARVVTKVLYGKRIEVMQKTKVELQLGWIKDNWYQVKYRGREGYIFGGYLNELPAPTGIEGTKLIADLLPIYCTTAFKPSGAPILTAEAEGIGDTLKHALYVFVDGQELEIENRSKRRTTKLLFNSSILETYVLLEALLKQSTNSDLLDELRFVKSKDGNLMRINDSAGTISIKRFSNEKTELQLVSHFVEK